VGRNGYTGVLTMSLSAIVSKKSHGNKKKFDEEDEEAEAEERQNFGLFGIALK